MNQPSQQQLAKTAKERQQAIDSVSAQHLARVAAMHNAGVKVDEEWLLIAEFALMYGWQAYKDFKQDDDISLIELQTMVEAGRRVKAADMYNNAYASFIGAVSANQKDPSGTFDKLTKEIIKKAKPNE